jgi:hypothetical protein
MVAPSCFNDSYIIDWVRKNLGDPTICVELDEVQIKQCIDDVKELFYKYRPKEYYVSQQYARGYHHIIKPEGAMGVLDVEFVRRDYMSYESVEGALLYDPFYFLSAGGLAGMDVQTYDMVRHWLEIISREFGSEEGYVLMDNGDLMIQVPGTFNVSIKWAMPWDNCFEDMHRPYQQLFLELVLAKSRMILGNIRGKFAQGVPGAGTAIQLDGEYQKTKGEQDLATYIEELKRISPHFLPSMG